MGDLSPEKVSPLGWPKNRFHVYQVGGSALRITPSFINSGQHMKQNRTDKEESLYRVWAEKLKLRSYQLDLDEKPYYFSVPGIEGENNWIRCPK